MLIAAAIFGGLALFVALFFLALHPLICIIECALSKAHSGSKKAIWIVATLLFGPIASVIYAKFSSKSEGLRRWTMNGIAVGALSFAISSGIAFVSPEVGNSLASLSNPNQDEASFAGAFQESMEGMNVDMEALDATMQEFEGSMQELKKVSEELAQMDLQNPQLEARAADAQSEDENVPQFPSEGEDASFLTSTDTDDASDSQSGIETEMSDMDLAASAEAEVLDPATDNVWTDESDASDSNVSQHSLDTSDELLASVEENLDETTPQAKQAPRSLEILNPFAQLNAEPKSTQPQSSEKKLSVKEKRVSVNEKKISVNQDSQANPTGEFDSAAPESETNAQAKPKRNRYRETQGYMSAAEWIEMTGRQSKPAVRNRYTGQ